MKEKYFKLFDAFAARGWRDLEYTLQHQPSGTPFCLPKGAADALFLAFNGVSYHSPAMLPFYRNVLDRLVWEGLTIWEYIFYPVILFFDFSGRFLNTGVKALLFLLAMPLAIVQFRKKDQPLEQKFLLFTMFTAVIIHCYFIVSVSPITHPERPLIRYLFTLFCVWNIIIVSYWHNIFQLGKGKIGKYIRGAYGAGFLVLCILLFANAVNEPLVKSDNLFSKIKVYQYMKQQKEKDLPVLIRYKKGRDFDTRTFKLIIAYKTFFGKTCELSLLRSRKEEYMKKEPVQCEKGYLYFLFDGRKPAPGETCKCIVITRDNVRMKELTFQKYSENLEK